MNEADKEIIIDIFKRFQLARKLRVEPEYSKEEIQLYEKHKYSNEYAALWDEVAEEYDGEKVHEGWANWGEYQRYKESLNESR